MTVFASDVDQSGIFDQFTSGYQVALVKTGVTLVSETDAVFASLSSSGSNVQVINYGSLFGDTTAVFFGFGATSATVFNFGVISGGPQGYGGIGLVGDSGKIINSGTIFAATAGVYMSGTQDLLTNSGSISAPIGVQMSGDSEVFTNTGTVTGSNDGISVRGTRDSITNRGTIDGSLDASMGSSATVRNKGTIDGNVLLGLNGSYDGRGGSIDGTITGGIGADAIRAGSDGETLGGGGGHDRLVGGTGADTFVFSSYSSADSDVVKGFDVSNDTLQFDSAVFKHLGVDETPAFAIGTKASSATDVLFYNAGTGNLYYDVDGSKTAHAPFLVANLGTGLHPTAKNFSVV